MIGRRHHVVIDCPDPSTLAAFYSELIGLPITYESEDWVVIAETDKTSGFAFQRALDHQKPRWPDRTIRSSSTWTSWWMTWPKRRLGYWPSAPSDCSLALMSTQT